MSGFVASERFGCSLYYEYVKDSKLSYWWRPSKAENNMSYTFYAKSIIMTIYAAASVRKRMFLVMKIGSVTIGLTQSNLSTLTPAHLSWIYELCMFIKIKNMLWVFFSRRSKHMLLTQFRATAFNLDFYKAIGLIWFFKPLKGYWRIIFWLGKGTSFCLNSEWYAIYFSQMWNWRQPFGGSHFLRVFS